MRFEASRAKSAKRYDSARPFRVVATPHPHECIRQRLLEHLGIAVSRGPAKYVTVVVASGFEGCRGALVGHYPVVIGFLRIFSPQIILRNMRKDAERFLLAIFNQ